MHHAGDQGNQGGRERGGEQNPGLQGGGGAELSCSDQQVVDELRQQIMQQLQAISNQPLPSEAPQQQQGCSDQRVVDNLRQRIASSQQHQEQQVGQRGQGSTQQQQQQSISDWQVVDELRQRISGSCSPKQQQQQDCSDLQVVDKPRQQIFDSQQPQQQQQQPKLHASNDENSRDAQAAEVHHDYQKGALSPTVHGGTLQPVSSGSLAKEGGPEVCVQPSLTQGHDLGCHGSREGSSGAALRPSSSLSRQAEGSRGVGVLRPSSSLSRRAGLERGRGEGVMGSKWSKGEGGVGLEKGEGEKGGLWPGSGNSGTGKRRGSSTHSGQQLRHASDEEDPMQVRDKKFDGWMMLY